MVSHWCCHAAERSLAVGRMQNDLAVEREKVRVLRDQLQHIADAKPSTWGDMSDQFQPWAQNRARSALAALARTEGGR